MREVRLATAWVVYRITVRGKPYGLGAVCEQGEWDAMELAHPGDHTLLRGGIRSEAEAEALARTSSGYGVGQPKAPAKPAAKQAKRSLACCPLYRKRLA